MAALDAALLNSLRLNPNNTTMRKSISRSSCPEHYYSLFAGGYVDFIAEQSKMLRDGEIRADGFPAWYTSAEELMSSFEMHNMISEQGRTLNHQLLVQLRHAVLHNLLKPMLSAVPGAGLQKIVRDSQAEDPVLPSVRKECLFVGGSLVHAVMCSLRHHPDAEYVESFRTAGAIEIAAICWYHSDVLVDRSQCTNALSVLFGKSTNPLKSPLSYMLRNLSVDQVVERSKQMLQDVLLSDQLWPQYWIAEAHLCMMICFPWDIYGLAEAMVRNGVLVTLLETGIAMAGKKRVNWELMHAIPKVTLVVSNVLPNPMPALIEYIERPGILRLVADVFVNKSFVDTVEGSWNVLLEMIAHCKTCKKSNCTLVCSNEYLDAMGRALKKDDLWSETMATLRALAEVPTVAARKAGRKKNMESWYKLGVLFELAEGQNLRPITAIENGVQSSTREGQSGCWSAKCERHGNTDEETEKTLNKCAGCKKAVYCSKECQTRDWKTLHKLECKVLQKV